ncbi:MAG: hypothetical protein ACKVP0_02450 [Pirellulaceae bacterium]
MLNLFKYIAVVIMLLATGEFLCKAVDAVSLLAQDAEPTPASTDAGRSSDSSGSTGGTAKPAKSVAQQVRAFIDGTLVVCTDPLVHFCYGATLLVLVRIARDQAHDLAIG